MTVRPDEELAHVTWRRGYLTGSFVAVRDTDAGEEIAESPKFRWRNPGAGAPPELPEVVACLSTLESTLASAGWERTGTQNGDWCALRFRRSLVPLTSRLQAYGVAPDEDIVTWLTDQATAAADDPIFGEEPWRVEAIREAVKRRDEERRLEAERLEAERREAQLREDERLQAELLEKARQEAQRLVAEQRAAEQQAAQRHDAEQQEAERLLAERLLAAQAEAEGREIEPATPEPATEKKRGKQRSTLQSRLSAYGGDGDPLREIRSAFAPKPASPRKRRFIW